MNTSIMKSVCLGLVLAGAACTEQKAADVAVARKEAVEAVHEINAAQRDITAKQATERAKSQAQQDKTLIAAEAKVDEASAKMVEQRRKVEAKVRERMSKLEARAQQLTGDAKASARAKTSDAIVLVQTRRDEVSDAIEELKTSSDASFATWEVASGKKLDDLETALKQLESKLK